MTGQQSITDAAIATTLRTIYIYIAELVFMSIVTASGSLIQKRELRSCLLVRGCNFARTYGEHFIAFLTMMVVFRDFFQKQDLLSSLLVRGCKPARTPPPAIMMHIDSNKATSFAQLLVSA